MRNKKDLDGKFLGSASSVFLNVFLRAEMIKTVGSPNEHQHLTLEPNSFRRRRENLNSNIFSQNNRATLRQTFIVADRDK